MISKGWRKVLRLAALNCGNEKNMALCNKHEARRFPSLKYFHFYTNEAEVLSSAHVLQKDTDKITRMALEGLVNDSFTKQLPYLSQFTPISNDESISNLMTKDLLCLVVIYQESNELLAEHILLDFLAFPRLKIVIVRPDHDSYKTLFQHEPPAMAIYRLNRPASPIYKSNHKMMHDGVAEIIQQKCLIGQTVIKKPAPVGLNAALVTRTLKYVTSKMRNCYRTLRKQQTQIVSEVHLLL
ncbi:unnamed protein product [Soboliphyme baturini]|uniref:Thioredoxin-like_fold domain-containing protein n=1 Tax=Soboliphyme baturini TaxID=241478 RepID=A0A183J9H7_9BILA|nr:unnamed protein product [Soboliphyme baturini]